MSDDFVFDDDDEDLLNACNMAQEAEDDAGLLELPECGGLLATGLASSSSRTVKSWCEGRSVAGTSCGRNF